MEVLEISSSAPSSAPPHPCPLGFVVWFVPDRNQGNQDPAENTSRFLSSVRGWTPSKGLTHRGPGCIGEVEAPFSELLWLRDS